MRLTCPNCSARYEVDDSLVPPEGRDVQCSNCATTWFQPGNRGHIEEPEAQSPEPETGSAAPDEAADAPSRRELDPAIRDLLREERDREEELRRAGGEAMEAQEEMALDTAPAPEPAPSAPPHEDEDDTETLAALRAATGMGGAAAAAPAARDLLPDIEEINSTLRATTDRNASEAGSSDIDTIEALPRRRRGFRLGFFLMVLIGALAVGAYVYHAEIAEALPAAAPVLDSYVDFADRMRVQLDDLMQGLAERLSNSASEG